MTKLTSDPSAVLGILSLNEQYPSTDVGNRIVTDDGCEYRYVQAGAANLVVGNLLQNAAEITNHQNLTPTAAVAIGGKQITVTLGATAVTNNYYSGGFMIVTTSTGAGYKYRISSHPAADASATLVLQLEDPILVATSTSSRIDLVANPYQGVIQNPTSATGTPLGVAVAPITALYYGFIQTRGVAAVLADGAVTVGTAVVASNATAGAVEALTGVQAPVGVAVTGIATTEIGAVRLTIG